MANSIYQGKINRQFWGKLIRQSTKKHLFTTCYLGGGALNYQNGSLITKATFFYGVRRIE